LLFIDLVHSSLVSAATAPAPAAIAAATVMLLLVLHEVLSDTAENSTSDGAQKAVPSLLAQKVAAEAAANGAEKATVSLVHRRSIGIVVWRVGIGGLSGELVVLNIWGKAGTLTLATHLLLITLVLAICITAAVLLSRGVATVVA